MTSTHWCCAVEISWELGQVYLEPELHTATCVLTALVQPVRINSVHIYMGKEPLVISNTVMETEKKDFSPTSIATLHKMC